jgi:hypothetical protein
MKQKIVSCILVMLAITGTVYGQDFYDINTINTVELTFEQSNWDSLLDSLYVDGNENRLIGTAKINGILFDSVGVRYKGNSSYNAGQNKNPLNIKLDYIIDGQEYEGYGTLKLANGYKDPSFVREVLSYEIARDYMPASLANFCKVFINGTYLGLYTSVQDVDKKFLRTHYYNGNNPFFKGELASGEKLTSVKVWGYFGADSTSYHDYYEIESDDGWTDLIGFLDILNNEPDSVEEVLNVDRHLWMLAFDILMVNLDSPVNFGHNYYLYKDNAGRFNPVIWDLNENYGVFSTLIDGLPLNITGMQQMDPFLNATNADYPIINKILTNPTYKKIYVAHMKTILDDHFNNGLYRTRALDLQNIIDSEIQNDPNTFFTYDQFKEGIDGSAEEGDFFVPQRPPGQPGQPGMSNIGITQLMDGRIAYLNAQYEFQALAPAISNIIYSPIQVSPNTDVWITAEASNADLVQLACRHNQTEAFGKVKMLDDGAHNDGAAGDGVYGVSVPAGPSGFQYYIYAENDDAACFFPERAEYEFHTLAVSADLVINEFMASNDTIADQDGEYDDWIELYNNTDAEIVLDGYYLSDDGKELTQWAFPDTSIAAKGYLIVWADKDEDQDGLHANFKLSASGEAIYLVNPETTIVNEVTFSEQTTDLSTGRNSDGTGLYISMNPTFAAPNQSVINGIENEDQLSQFPAQFTLKQNYPNPFNPQTSIQYELSLPMSIQLDIFNLTGQKIKTLVNEYKRAGNHSVTWDGTDASGENVSSGIYIYSLHAGGNIQTSKMILTR